MAAEYDLHPIFKREFHEMFEDEHEHPEFGPLMERMKVRDRDGASQMDEDQWEAASEFLSPFFFFFFYVRALFPCCWCFLWGCLFV